MTSTLLLSKVGTIAATRKSYHVRLNTYTLEEVRQEAGGRRQKGFPQFQPNSIHKRCYRT
ncbi:MAG: hypothetical protein F6K48_12125 [Okeania sp. SIO3H1]|nr:hypothetical protein [Okeania sp. SIO3H1]